jgi:hypothetical protein
MPRHRSPSSGSTNGGDQRCRSQHVDEHGRFPGAAQRASVGAPMTRPALSIGHDAATGEPILVSPGKFAVVIARSGRITTYGAPVLHGLILDELAEEDSEARAERFATRVAAKLGASAPMEPERLDIGQAAAVASVSPKALRHRVQRGLVPERLIIREGRRLFFVADGWRKFLVSQKSGGR